MLYTSYVVQWWRDSVNFDGKQTSEQARGSEALGRVATRGLSGHGKDERMESGGYD